MAISWESADIALNATSLYSVACLSSLWVSFAGTHSTCKLHLNKNDCRFWCFMNLMPIITLGYFTLVQVFNVTRGNVRMLIIISLDVYMFYRFYRRNHSECSMNVLRLDVDLGDICCRPGQMEAWNAVSTMVHLFLLYWNIGSVTVFMWCFCSLYQLRHLHRLSLCSLPHSHCACSELLQQTSISVEQLKLW